MWRAVLVNDVYHSRRSGVASSPVLRASRVLRGSAWDNCDPERLLSSFHWCATTSFRGTDVGFRCVLGESAIAPTKAEKSSAPLESLSPNASPNDTGAQKLTKVFVKKYGFSVLLPTDVFPEAAKLTTGEETQLIATDDLTTLEFYDSNESLTKNYRSRIADSAEAQGRTIEYKILKENWFVVSGKFGPDAKHAANMGFYTKAVKKGPKVIFMHLRYKEEDPLISDEVLTAMSRSFDGN